MVKEIFFLYLFYSYLKGKLRLKDKPSFFYKLKIEVIKVMNAKFNERIIVDVAELSTFSTLFKRNAAFRFSTKTVKVPTSAVLCIFGLINV